MTRGAGGAYDRPAMKWIPLAIVALAGCASTDRPKPDAAEVDRRLARVEAATERLAAQPVAFAPATGPATRPVTVVGAATQPTVPFTVERFERDGPVRGVVVRVDLRDPRVRLKVALADPRDPDGDGPAIGRLETVSAAARQQNFAVALNASFFDIAGARTILGKRVGYYVGNGAWPVGFHMSDGRTLAEPKGPTLRAAMVVHSNGRVTLDANLDKLPDDARQAVSGSARVLADGIATVPAVDAARNPRSAVGLSGDGRTLLLVAVDGRRDGWSRGVTFGELAALMKDLGASDAINLDGGGSTSLVVRDAVTGVYAVANRPSERNALRPEVDSVERPVVDLIGVSVEGE